jgi:DNA-binding SARP family transcriptional activator
VEFRILGSLEVESEGTRLDLGPPKQQAVLAVLLLHANEIVSTEKLIEQVWPERPPRTAAHSIQIYVSELRRTFEPHAGAPLITTRPPGYLLEVAPECVDAERFAQLVADGLRGLHDGDRASGRDALRSALRMWRGPPLSDFTYEEFAQSYVHRLTGLRLDALEELAAAELDQDRPQEALPLLRTAVGDDPLRERCRELRMLALYRAGRQAEALREYQQFRKLLDDELGLDPSPPLRRLEERILLHDGRRSTGRDHRRLRPRRGAGGHRGGLRDRGLGRRRASRHPLPGLRLHGRDR